MPTGKRKRRSIWWIYEPFYTYHLHNLRVHSVWHEVSAGNLQERHAGTEIAEVFEKRPAHYLYRYCGSRRILSCSFAVPSSQNDRVHRDPEQRGEGDS